MTQIEERHSRRINLAARKVIGFIPLTDHIICEIHKVQPYDLFMDYPNNFLRVCVECTKMFFADVQPASPTDTTICAHPGCINPILEGLLKLACGNCKKYFCRVHMEVDNFCCTACEQEADDLYGTENIGD